MKYIKLKDLLKEDYENADSPLGMTAMKKIHISNFDEFTRSYLITALWSSTDNLEDNGGDPLDKNYDIKDIEHNTLLKMVGDCKDFQQKHKTLYLDGGWNETQAGRDFWLTRNGHGTGFWDVELHNPKKEKIGEELTKYAKSYGTYDLFLCDGRQEGMICGG